MTKRIAILVVVFWMFCPFASAWSQVLQRRSFIGLGVVKQDSHVVGRQVEMGSTAEKAGVLAGDILLTVGDIVISDANQLEVASPGNVYCSAVSF